MIPIQNSNPTSVVSQPYLDLPDEILLAIFNSQCLPVPDLIKCRRVCRQWCQVVTSEKDFPKVHELVTHTLPTMRRALQQEPSVREVQVEQKRENRTIAPTQLGVLVNDLYGYKVQFFNRIHTNTRRPDESYLSFYNPATGGKRVDIPAWIQTQIPPEKRDGIIQRLITDPAKSIEKIHYLSPDRFIIVCYCGRILKSRYCPDKGLLLEPSQNDIGNITESKLVGDYLIVKQHSYLRIYDVSTLQLSKAELSINPDASFFAYRGDDMLYLAISLTHFYFYQIDKKNKVLKLIRSTDLLSAQPHLPAAPTAKPCIIRTLLPGWQIHFLPERKLLHVIHQESCREFFYPVPHLIHKDTEIRIHAETVGDILAVRLLWNRDPLDDSSKYTTSMGDSRKYLFHTVLVHAFSNQIKPMEFLDKGYSSFPYLAGVDCTRKKLTIRVSSGYQQLLFTYNLDLPPEPPQPSTPHVSSPAPQPPTPPVAPRSFFSRLSHLLQRFGNWLLRFLRIRV